MTDTPDAELLRQFARNRSETAFAELVERHLGLVYSTALRKTENPQHAYDIAQAVFIILARKAGSLSPKTVLSGWLYHTARLTACNFQRAEMRRIRREQEAFMESTMNETAQDALWRELSPFLEDAMARLAASDRDAIVLRFFQNRSMAEVGTALGANEDSARMRVNRALEKLRKIFKKCGIVSTTAIIAGVISTNSVQAAPAGLATNISAVALAKGAAASSSSLTLVKGALKIMTWAKAKTAIVVGIAAVLTAGTATVAVKNIFSSNAWADDPKYWSLNDPQLASYPSVLILRPTRFVGRSGLVGNGNRFVGRDLPVQDLVAIAYGFLGQGSAQIIFPGDLPQFRPQSGYDLLLTLPYNGQKALQQAIAKKFGLMAHTETIVTNVLLERVADPDAPGLKRSSSRAEPSSWDGGYRSVMIRNQSLKSFLLGTVENEMGKPVRDETGLTGRYDLQMQWNPQPGETDSIAFERALREQLGIELVATNMPIEMLAVEKTK